MSVSRTERLLNVVIALLAARAPVSRAVIQRSVAGYDPDASTAAFERMFERDKDELRAMGIPVITVSDAHGEVLGYRIDEDEYRQGDIDLTAEELAVLSVAARVWDEAVLAPAAVTAMRKLEATSQFGQSAEVPTTFGSISATDAALLPVMRAIRDRRIIRFAYRKPGAPELEKRTVEPWMVRSLSGRWYLIGWDTDRGDERVFRLSRVTGPVTITAQTVTERTHEPRTTVRAEGGDEVEATVLIPAGTGAELRRLAGSQHVSGDTWTIRAPRFELLTLLWRADASVVVEAPADLVDDVVAGLDRIVAAHS